MLDQLDVPKSLFLVYFGQRSLVVTRSQRSRHMDLVKRNVEIVALVKARKMPMREIAARYRLSTSSISLMAIRHGVHAQAADPKKVQAASKLIQRGMPLRHVAQTVGLHYQRYVTSWQSKASTRCPRQMVGLGRFARCASFDGITASPDIRCAPSLPGLVALARALIQRRPCSD